jgi:hypothetical protein
MECLADCANLRCIVTISGLLGLSALLETSANAKLSKRHRCFRGGLISHLRYRNHAEISSDGETIGLPLRK